jgi:single-strand DNA-binding protein
MTDTISITGFIATDPRGTTTEKGLNITSFRMASVGRRFNSQSGQWEDTQPNWYTVNCFRKLAEHASQSLVKGDRIVLRGRVRIRDWDNGERSGTAVEIDADSIGHDLMFGISSFERTTHTPDPEEEESEAELQPA